METYTDVINNRIAELTNDWDQYKWDTTEQQLRIWMNQRSKHFATDFFDNSDNRICYVRRLYRCRVDCFYEILKSTTINSQIEEIITKKSSVVSFGCGPGPEIVAYICYVRNILHCKYQQLDITAVDCLEQWGTFIDVVANLDQYATITFQAGRLCNQYLLDMKQSDVCIMSYPHAMNFEDIWVNLKRKFTLIIFIDQAKVPLIQIANLHGFQLVPFVCKGSKTFFYYIDKDYGSKCKRMIHDKHSSIDSCQELIDIFLRCGHSDQIYCHQDEQTMKMTKMCREKVRVDCVRHLHGPFILCGSKERCREMIQRKLKCGHMCQSRCDESSKIEQICRTMVSKMCERGIHEITIPCSSPFICDTSISLTLTCGHRYSGRCSETSLRKTMKCSAISKYKCKRQQLHDLSSVCGSIVRCENMVQVNQKCGHSGIITCGDDSTRAMDGSKCLETITKTCERGLHRQSMNCSSLLICKDSITCRLTCGHESVIQCFEDKSFIIKSRYCKVLVDKKCKRSIHTRKQECYQTSVCAIKYSVMLQCGCRRLVKCDEYEGAKERDLCLEDCRERAREMYASSQQGEDNVGQSCGSVHDETGCENTCNKLLECGHVCRWRCFLCLNGRLHRPCVEKCSRTLQCGHQCVDFCHGGDCANCSSNCLLQKVRRLLQFKQNMSANDQTKWSDLLGPWMESSQMVDWFEKVLFVIKGDEFSKKMLENYRFIFVKMKKLLDFVDVVYEDNFPAEVKRYVDAMKVSSVAMIRWINPDDWSMKTADNRSFLCFDKEFDRIKTIFSVCCVMRSYLEANLSHIPNELLVILDSLLDEVSTENSLSLLLPKLSCITEKHKYIRNIIPRGSIFSLLVSL